MSEPKTQSVNVWALDPCRREWRRFELKLKPLLFISTTYILLDQFTPIFCKLSPNWELVYGDRQNKEIRASHHNTSFICILFYK